MAEWQPSRELSRRTRRSGVFLNAIWRQLHLPYDPTAMDSPLNIELVVERLVNMAIQGRDADSFQAIKLMLLYFEDAPGSAGALDVEAKAKEIAAEVGCDPQWLVNEARRIAADLERSAL